MRASVITRPGGPEVLQLRDDVEPPTPRAREILVRVHATALNRADLLQRRGNYPAPAGWPADIPGLEYAGTVAALGAGATRWQIGDRVMGLVGGGAYAEYVAVHEDEALPVPARLTLEQAAAIPEAYFTAHDALFTQAEIRTGESVLVHAIASGVGTAALQLARAARCTVLGTSRTPEKLARMRALGLEHAIDAHDDWSARAREITGGRGVDVVLDLVGGDYLPGNIAALAPRGRLILIGLVAGRTAQLDMGTVLRQRMRIIGTAMRSRSHEEKVGVCEAFARDALEWLATGEIAPVIERVVSMREVAGEHAAMERNENVGKIVLVWD